jgi:hypothetical protein
MKRRAAYGAVPWGALLLAAALFCGDSAAAVPPDAALPAGAASLKDAETLAGVEVVAVRLTAAGRMLDFRYRVTDPGKASALLNRKTKAHAIHLPTGKVMGVPRVARVGRMKSSAVEGKRGTVYFLFLDARGQQVKSGDRVTVVIGEHRFEDLAVQ